MLEELLDTFFDKDFSPQTFQTFISIIGLVLLCVVVIISISIYLWRSKGEKDGRIFTVTCNGLGEQSEKIQALLKELKANKKGRRDIIVHSLDAVPAEGAFKNDDVTNI